jgi:GNAT superfamily N-acetyltransferase
VTTADADRLLEMGEHFLADTVYGGLLPNDPAHLSRILAVVLQQGTVLLAEREGTFVGMLAGLVYEHFVTGRRTANETVLWVEPSARTQGVGEALLEAFHAWARTQGATQAQVGSWNERLDRYYARLGYVATERIFTKDLT